MRFTLEIGGYRIAVNEPRDHPILLWPLRPFDVFLVDDHNPADVTVTAAVVPTLPDLPTDRLRFDSDHGHWKLFESGDHLVLDSLSPKTGASRARARLSPDYRQVEAWVLPDFQNGQVGWSPMHLFNPILEVCLLSSWRGREESCSTPQDWPTRRQASSSPAHQEPVSPPWPDGLPNGAPISSAMNA